MKKYLIVLVVVLLSWGSLTADGRRSRRSQPVNWQPVTQGFQMVVGGSDPAPYSGADKECKDALDEVNAARAKRGCAPFARDAKLCEAAYLAAKDRAASHNAGHTNNDFDYARRVGAEATSAGCAAWEPSWGWGSCCAYDNYTYAGAAWVMGSDGRRYMHLFVR